MTAGIIAILAALVPFIIWLWKRNDAKKDDPLQQNRQRYQQIDQDIAAHNSSAASAHASDDLDQLDRLQTDRSRDSR